MGKKYTAIERKLLEVQEYQCFFCEKHINLNSVLATRDHLYPRSEGFTYGNCAITFNKVLACKSCNQKKGHGMPSPAAVKKFWKIKQDIFKQTPLITEAVRDIELDIQCQLPRAEKQYSDEPATQEDKPKTDKIPCTFNAEKRYFNTSSPQETKVEENIITTIKKRFNKLPHHQQKMRAVQASLAFVFLVIITLSLVSEPLPIEPARTIIVKKGEAPKMITDGRITKGEIIAQQNGNAVYLFAPEYFVAEPINLAPADNQKGNGAILHTQ